MINLLDLKPTKISRDLRGKIILIYGEYKSGKTYNASKFPKTLLFAFEKGYNAIDGIYAVPITKWMEFLGFLRQLRKPDLAEKFQTIVIDTVDIAWDLCEKFVADNHGVDDIGKIPYGAGYRATEKAFDEALRSIVMMDYGLVMISHDEDKTFTDEDGEEFNKIVPTLSKRPRKVVLRMTDINGYSKTIETEGGLKQVLYLRGTPRFEAGSRWRYIPDRIDFTYANLVGALDEAITKQELEGADVVDEHINIHVENEVVYDYDALMAEAKELFLSLTAKSPAYTGKITSIVSKYVGPNKKLIDTTPEDAETVYLVVQELRELNK